MEYSNSILISRSSTAEHMRIVLSVAAAVILVWLGGCCHTATTSIPATDAVPPVRFLGPDDFQGGFIPAAGQVKEGLQSTYSGTVVVTMIDRTVVEKVLPQGVRLANPVAASTNYPVIYLIGDQREPSILCNNGTVTPVAGAANGYKEMIMLVPFVVFGAGANWHNYAVRMYLDDWIAVAGGDVIYGYAKQFADLNKTQTAGHTIFQVSRPLGGPVWFKSDVQAGPLVAFAQAVPSLPRWTDLQKIFTMPVLGQNPPDIFNPPDLITSYWEWDFANAKLAPATSQHQVVTSFRGGMEGWVTPGPLFNALDGAVYMDRVRWRLALPLPLLCPP